MVTETDEIITVGKRHDALRIDLRHWEDVLQNITDAIAEFGLEVVKDEVRVSLTNWVDLILKVVA